MIDDDKLILLKRLGLAFSALALIGLGYGLGSFQSKGTDSVQMTKQPKGKTYKVEAEVITTEYVNDFLTAYFTRKDLEENRTRYKPFMTTSLYEATVAEEEEPINQAYKGYTVDQEFQSAVIYIDQTQAVAIVEVNYTQTILQEKGNYKDNVLKDQAQQMTLKLTFTRDKEGYLVNAIQQVMIDEVNL